jgi:hypothetical protein
MYVCMCVCSQVPEGMYVSTYLCMSECLQVLEYTVELGYNVIKGT